MQMFRLTLWAMVALIAVVAPASAQRVQVQPGGFPGRAGTSLLSADALEKLKLTADQKDLYAKIETEFKEKSKQAQEKFRDEIKALRDREKYKEAMEKLQGDTKKIRVDALEKMEKALTADQKAVFAQVKQEQPRVNPGIVRPILPFGGGVGQILPPGAQQRLKLTDDQKKQIDNIQKEVEAKILKVLTEEQKKQFEEMKKAIPARPVRPLEANPAVRNARRAVEPPATTPKKD